MTELRPSPVLIHSAAVTLFLSVLLLPLWDGTRGGTATWGPAGIVLALVSAGVFLRGSLRTRWITFAVSGLFIVLYSSVSGGLAFLERSRLVSRLPDCATPSTGEKFEAAAGPRMKDGTPCVYASEERDKFRKRHPTGEMFDGFRQMLLRYPQDLTRIMVVPMVAMFLIATAGILFAKAMGPLLTAQRDRPE